MTEPAHASVDEHLALAAKLAAFAVENNHAGYAPSALAYAGKLARSRREAATA